METLSPHEKLTARGIARQAEAMRWQPDKRGWTYPVYDRAGVVIARRWKAYDSAAKPKYLWLDGTKAQVYHVGAGLRDAITDAGGVLYIANGEPAVLTFHAAGLFNVLSFFGESILPNTVADDLLALDVQIVRYYPDQDQAGQRAALKLRAALQGSGITFDCRALPADLPDKADTNDWWQKLDFDAVVFQAALSDAPAADLPAPETAPALIRRQQQAAPVGGQSVNWDAERTCWWTQIVLPALDAAAPVQKGRGKYQYRYCPNPTHADHTPSFRISTDKNADGLPICTCGVQDERDPRGAVASWVSAPAFMDWWKTERAPLFTTTRRTKTERIQAANQTITMPALSAGDADRRVNLRYISELPLDTFAAPGIYLIASVQDTGKTRLLERLTAHWDSLVCRGVVHRVTLTAELARRLACESQLDLFPEDQRLPRTLITTLPSIVNQIDPQTGALRPIDVLYIDEVEQVLSAIFSSTIDKRERLNIFNTLVTAIRRAKYVICLDADAGSVAYDFLKSIRDDVTLIVNEYRNTDRLMQTYASKEALQKALYKALETQNEVIAVPCTSDRFATKLARKCARLVGAEKVMLVCAETKNDPTVREFLKNPDANAARYRAIIYTSSMGSGVDISNTHAAAVFGFFGRQPLTAWDMHQMLMRFRHADTYNVWVDPVEANLPTSEQSIYERLLDQERGTKEAVLFGEDGIDLMRRARLQLARLQAAVTARENQSKCSVRTHFLALANERYSLVESADDVSPEQRQQIRGEMKAIGEVLAEEYEERLLSTTPIPAEAYKQHAIKGEITPEIEAGHVREQIEQLYAQAITRPAIRDFDDGQGVRKLKLLELMYKPQSEAVSYDRRELSDRVPIGDMTHVTKKRLLMLEALRLFIRPDRAFSEEAEIDIETITQALGDFRDKHERDIRRYFGWRQDYSSKPINLLRFLLAEVGLKLEEVGADRQRLYRARKALQKQGMSREEAVAALPAPPKRYRLERSSLARMERYISQRRERALQESGEDLSLPLRVRKVAA